MKGKLNWKSVDEAAARVAKWPEWKKQYRIGTGPSDRPKNDGKRDEDEGLFYGSTDEI